jgi:hypothetical protein
VFINFFRKAVTVEAVYDEFAAVRLHLGHKVSFSGSASVSPLPSASRRSQKERAPTRGGGFRQSQISDLESVAFHGKIQLGNQEPSTLKTSSFPEFLSSFFTNKVFPWDATDLKFQMRSRPFHH